MLTFADIEKQYKKEKGSDTKWTEERYTLNYVWWLENRIIKLEDKLKE